MRARIERSELMSMLDLVAPAVQSKALPVLACVRIDVKGKSVTFTASNIDLTITAETLAGSDSAKGTALVPHKLLSQAVAKMGDGAVSLDSDGETLTAAGWPGKVKLRCANVDDWPNLPAAAEGADVKLSASDVELLARILPFASTNLERRGIACVTFGESKALTTDSYRLGSVDLAVDVPACKVPTDAVAAAVKAAGDADLLVTVGPSWITFATDRAAWTSRLVAEDSPNVTHFESLIASQTSQELTVNREALIAACDLVRAGAGGQTVAKFEGADGTLAISLRSDSEAEAELLADGSIACSLDLAYVRSLCVAARGETVTLASLDHLKPVHVTEGPLRMLCMPVRAT